MKGTKIVVIEDEEDIRGILDYTLTREGFVVTCIEDGLRGLAMVRKTLPDLVLLDLMLPGLDGLEICRRLKQDEDTREIAIVMVSAKGEESSPCCVGPAARRSTTAVFCNAASCESTRSATRCRPATKSSS